MHDERVLAIKSPPGILLSVTGHLHLEGTQRFDCEMPTLSSEIQFHDQIVPSVQEQFGDSEKA